MVIFLIFLLALILRLILSPLGFHVDILSNAGWGQWIYTHGTLGFYENNTWVYSWPTQPPFVSLLYGFDNWFYIFLLEIFRSTGNIIVRYHLAPGHMVWFFDFIKWFDVAKTSTEAIFSTGYLVTIKLLPILADLGIAAVIYKISKSKLFAAIYLFSPFSWYLSSLWGQYDALSFLPAIGAFILASKNKYSHLTPIILALSIAVKPTTLIFVPYFIYIYFKNRPKTINILISLIFILIFFIATTQIFTNKNLIDFTVNELYGKIFLKSASRLSANAFNFWRIVMSSKIQTQDSLFLFLPAFMWGVASYILLNILAFRLSKKVTTQNIIKSLFIIGAGSWIFMTNMLDRYLFAGIVSGLIISIYDKRLFKYWLILSFIFALNLYNQWWFPDQLGMLKNILLWQDSVVTKLLSVINIIVFIRMTFLLV